MENVRSLRRRVDGKGCGQSNTGGKSLAGFARVLQTES